MPNANVSVYLNDEDFKEYLKDKKGYNDIARDALKKVLKKVR